MGTNERYVTAAVQQILEELPRRTKTMDDSAHSLRAGLPDRYKIKKEIGGGGMATVYLAEDRKQRRPVALKVFQPEPTSAFGADRFLREIAIVAHLTHPHIVPLYDSGEVGGIPYYVMPYVDEGSLRERLNREKQLPLDEAVQLTREVAAALHFAHSKDVVHRDIKPENILLANGHAVVADFGIAHAICTGCLDSLGIAGVLVGTPAYISPEQVSDDNIDPRSDIYSLACVLYEMLTGEVPYSGRHMMSTVTRHVLYPIPSVRKLHPDVPEAVDAAITKALAKRPVDRFPTADVFGEALAGAVPQRTAVRTGLPTR